MQVAGLEPPPRTTTFVRPELFSESGLSEKHGVGLISFYTRQDVNGKPL